MNTTNDFIQKAPQLTNTYLSDPILKSFIDVYIAKDYQNEIQQDLKSFGGRCTNDILEMARDCEDNPPYLEQFDAWGNRIDNIITSKGWKDLSQVASQEGIVAHGYIRKYAQYSRIFQFMKLYLFHPSSAFFSCPLAMTDGAAKLIELSEEKALQDKAFKHLTSMSPDQFWTSGQWMTEKTGGSDVSRTESIAKKSENQYKLYGTKWFTSATTSQMAMALARIEDENGNMIEGSRGLSLFYIELRDNQKKLKNIEIIRLKNKLGTKALPTAELKLNGTPATLVGNIGEGVKTIANLFNVTRIYNSVTSCGALRRVLDLAIDYSKKREAFKKNLQDHPLHVKTLAKIEVDFSSCFHLTFFVAKLLGDEECPNKNALPLDQTKALLRLLTPVTKLYTAKRCMTGTTELLESFGGVGYIEDSGIPQFLRDNQVFSIWEGTTNVLSLDVLRAIEKEKVMETFFPFLKKRIKNLETHQKNKVTEELQKLEDFFEVAKNQDRDYLQSMARELSFSLAHIVSGVLMMEFSNKTQKDYDHFCSQEFRKRDWCQFSLRENNQKEQEKEIVFRNF